MADTNSLIAAANREMVVDDQNNPFDLASAAKTYTRDSNGDVSAITVVIGSVTRIKTFSRDDSGSIIEESQWVVS